MEFSEFVNASSKKPLKMRRSSKFGPKLWKAKQADAIQMWKDARIDSPVIMTPISKSHRGNRYAEDGIRITGTYHFINSVLGKLKDILTYQSPNVGIEVEYRQIEDKAGVRKGVPKFVYYIHLKEKGGTKPTGSKKPSI